MAKIITERVLSLAVEQVHITSKLAECTPLPQVKNIDELEDLSLNGAESLVSTFLIITMS